MIAYAGIWPGVVYVSDRVEFAFASGSRPNLTYYSLAVVCRRT